MRLVTSLTCPASGGGDVSVGGDHGGGGGSGGGANGGGGGERVPGWLFTVTGKKIINKG